jgi:hypothetical protein
MPKTGGNWVREVVRRTFPEMFIFIRFPNNDPHIPLEDLRELFLEHSKAEEFCFLRNGNIPLRHEEKLEVLNSFSAENPPHFYSFIRHPLSWWTSFWLYRQRTGWQPDHWIDSLCRSDNFAVFIENVLQRLPGGWNRMSRMFIGSNDKPVDGIGRQENLLQDLSGFLNAEGLVHDPAQLQSLQRINASEGHKPVLSPELAARLAASESELLEKFYPGSHNPSENLSLPETTDGQEHQVAPI